MVTFFLFLFGGHGPPKKKKKRITKDHKEIWFHSYDWGSPSGVFFFILLTLDLCHLLIHCDLWNSQKWEIFNFRESRFGFFFIFRETPLFLKFSSMEKVFKIDLHLQTFFSSIFICILGGIRLSCLPLNCHYHQIGFALKQVVPVSY